MSTSVTRQCCGIGCGGGPDRCGGAAASAAPAGLNNPAATSTALVMVARSSSRLLSSAHGMFRAPDAAATIIANMLPPRGPLTSQCRPFHCTYAASLAPPRDRVKRDRGGSERPVCGRETPRTRQRSKTRRAARKAGAPGGKIGLESSGRDRHALRWDGLLRGSGVRSLSKIDTHSLQPLAKPRYPRRAYHLRRVWSRDQS